MNRSLVLNASYEPLGVVSTRRAILLVMTGKASTLAASGTKWHSRSMELDAPSVILLTHYVHVPRRRIALTRQAALDRYGHVCGYCGKHGDTLDHVVPRARGGTHTWDNVLIACFRCNNKKSDKLLSELGWRLPFELKEPEPNVASFITMRWGEPAWEEYTSPWRRRELRMAG
ncbi:MAG: endonuclease [Microbacteriaceae bacterium]|jgi:5-methylcytosine-specific restriction endonuclease McrA|nr:endonuclease [Microbacteriaceae bacterium]